MLDQLKTQSTFVWILMVAMLSICTELSSWAIAIALSLCVYRIYLPLPSKKVTGGLGLLLFALIYFQFGSFWGREPATHFLALLTALKFLEYRDRRDERFLFLLGLFLIVAKFLFSIELFVFLFQILLLYFYLHSYLALHTKEKFHKFLLIQMIYSLPLAIGLFVFFPRLTYNFKPLDQTSKKVGFSGFSDQMEPGDVSELVQSDELVFRARLIDNYASAENLYWRGGVLEVNEGFGWRKNPNPAGFTRKFPVSRTLLNSSGFNKSGTSVGIEMQERVNYQIVLEPHSNLWLFALDRPLSLTADEMSGSREAAGVYQLQYPLKKRVSYQGISSIESFLNIERQKKWLETTQIRSSDQNSTSGPDQLLQFKDVTLPVQNLISKIAMELEKENKKSLLRIPRLLRAKRLLEHFQQEQFSYSLKPPAGNDSLEKFLLENKVGYCEHYSSSFVILARALKVPSRVVVGYYGGEYNSLGDFWKITQRNAHAWAEILLENGRWMRVDPTAVLGENIVQLGQSAVSRSRPEDQGTWREVWSDFQLSLDVINFRWTSFLLDYNLENQQEIFSLVIQYFQNISVIFLILVSLFFIFKHFRSLLKKRNELMKVDGVYAEFSEITHRPKSQGPWAWHQEFSEKEKETGSRFTELSEDVTLTYMKNAYHPDKKKPRNLAGLRMALHELREKYRK